MQNELTNEQIMMYLSRLPDCDLLESSTIDAPLGANQYYSARTVIDLLITASKNAIKHEREQCAKVCEQIMTGGIQAYARAIRARGEK